MFSLRTLFVVVAIAALAVAAMVSEVYWLITAFVVVTLAILCWSLLERQAAFWRGLFVFGTVYLVCACVSTFSMVSDALPSTYLHWVITGPKRPDVIPYFASNYVQEAAPQRQHVFAAELREGKKTVVHCIAALLFGLVGGLLYAWQTKKRRP